MQKRNVMHSVFVLGLAALAISSRAEAALVIDQQSTTANSFIGPGSGQGQSFTPTFAGIDFATFNLTVGLGGTPTIVFATLFSGDGFNGTFLGLSDTVLVDATPTFQEYEFAFSSTIALTPGQVYTLSLNNGFSNLYALEGSGDPYAGGVEYDSNLVAQPDYDLVFSEGVWAVPEPSALFVTAVGSLTLGVRQIWRRRNVRQRPAP